MSAIESSICHPSAGVWAVLNGKKLRIECAKCGAEVCAFDRAFAKCSCGDPNCNQAQFTPMYLHCRKNIFHTGNKVRVDSNGEIQTAIICCAECGAGNGRIQLAEQVAS